MRYNLVPHPSTPPAAPPFEVWATVSRAAGLGAVATTNLVFGVGAPAKRFHLPIASQPTRSEGLWRTTCFEAFLRRDGEAGYREWNFTTSTHWAAYDFTAYREEMAEAEVGSPPYILMENNLTWWALTATISVEVGVSWALGLSAVLEERDGTKSMWALAHGSDQPDFHQPDCFTARLA